MLLFVLLMSDFFFFNFSFFFLDITKSRFRSYSSTDLKIHNQINRISILLQNSITWIWYWNLISITYITIHDWDRRIYIWVDKQCVWLSLPHTLLKRRLGRRGPRRKGWSFPEEIILQRGTYLSHDNDLVPEKWRFFL